LISHISPPPSSFPTPPPSGTSLFTRRGCEPCGGLPSCSRLWFWGHLSVCSCLRVFLFSTEPVKWGLAVASLFLTQKVCSLFPHVGIHWLPFLVSPPMAAIPAPFQFWYPISVTLCLIHSLIYPFPAWLLVVSSL